MLFDHDAQVVGRAQREHQQHFPRSGWVEHDAERDLGEHAGGDHRRAGRAGGARAGDRRDRHHQPARDTSCGTARRAAGRQRDRVAGHPHPARSATGSLRTAAPTASAHGPDCRSRRTSPARRSRGCSTTSRRARARRGRRSAVRHDRHLAALEPDRRHRGGMHVTDATNASRTLLMDLDTLDWVPETLLELSACRASMLPEIGRRRRCTAGSPRRAARGVPIAGILGDQQAATFGQAAFDARRGKEHVRHGQLPAAEHRRPTSCESSTGWSRPSAYRCGDEPAATRSRARSPSRARSCSGCATTSA